MTSTREYNNHKHMKLPKNLGFGTPNLGDMMRKAQEAMEKAKHLEDELALETFMMEKGPLQVTFDGRGALIGLKITDKEVLEDLEMFEDLIVAAARDGFEKATEVRQQRVGEIMPDVPGLGNLLS